jgi:hypothetical protein
VDLVEGYDACANVVQLCVKSTTRTPSTTDINAPWARATDRLLGDLASSAPHGGGALLALDAVAATLRPDIVFTQRCRLPPHARSPAAPPPPGLPGEAGRRHCCRRCFGSRLSPLVPTEPATRGSPTC